MSHKREQDTTRTALEPVPQLEHSSATTRKCVGPCGLAISTKRLAAQPNARMCVPCLEAAGDVPVMKRFDETTGDGEQLQTFFTKNRRIETEILHRNKVIASQQNFDYAVGDDSHLGREDNEILDGGRSLSSVFVDEPDAPIRLIQPFREEHDRPIGSGYHLNILTLSHGSFEIDDTTGQRVITQAA